MRLATRSRSVLAVAGILAGGSLLVGCSGGTAPDLDEAEAVAVPAPVREALDAQAEEQDEEVGEPRLVGSAGGVTYVAVPVDGDTEVCLVLYRDDASDGQWGMGCGGSPFTLSSQGLGSATIDLDGVPDDPEDGTRISDWVVVHD